MIVFCTHLLHCGYVKLFHLSTKLLIVLILALQFHSYDIIHTYEIFCQKSNLYQGVQTNRRLIIQIYHKHILFILENVVNHVQSDEISNEKIMKRKCNDSNYIRNKFRLLNTTHTNFIVL